MLALMSCQWVQPPEDLQQAKLRPPTPTLDAEKLDFDNAYTSLIQPKCLGCHSEQRHLERGEGVNLEGRENVELYWFAIRNVIERNEMPPRNKLSERERDFVMRWTATRPFKPEAIDLETVFKLVIEPRCVRCHIPGGVRDTKEDLANLTDLAPMENVREFIDYVDEQVFGEKPDRMPYRRPLTAEEKGLLKAWINEERKTPPKIAVGQ